jgi:hypothetical protein
MENEPKTLMEAVRYFSDADRTLATMVSLRWPEGVTCPTCGRADPRFIATRRMWECKDKHPRKQFSAKIGTIFEDSPLGLDKWFVAIWSVANCKNGISSHELGRAIGVTQKTGWFMLHRIRLAMQTGSFIKMTGEAEADETFIGGLAKNMHAHIRKARVHGTGAHDDKVTVLGIMQRTSAQGASRVRAKVIKDANTRTLHGMVHETVEGGSTLHTDAWLSYRGLNRHYVHEVINHAVEYVRGNVHTNGIENFWSLLKRSIKGTYVSVEPFHLQRYVEEQTFRFNERKDNDGARFKKVLGSVTGKRLTYKALISHATSQAAA